MGIQKAEIESFVTAFDGVAEAATDGFNTVDNNGISFIAFLWRFFNASMVENFALFGVFGLGLAVISFGIDIAYYYRYRNAWDAYLKRELDRSDKKILERLQKLEAHIKGKFLTPQMALVLNQFRLLLTEYQQDTKKLRKALSDDVSNGNGKVVFQKELEDIEKRIQELTEALNKISTPPVVDAVSILDPTPPEAKSKTSKEDLSVKLEKTQAERNKATYENHLKKGISQFVTSPLFKAAFWYAWVYWFVFFVTMWGLAAFTIVPMSWSLLSILGPLFYIGYKEVIRYFAKVKETDIGEKVKDVRLADGTHRLEVKLDGKTVQLTQEQVDQLLEYEPQDLIVETEAEIDLIKDENEKEIANARRISLLQFCSTLDMGVSREQIKDLHSKVSAWDQREQGVLGFWDFRASWVFTALIGGFSAVLLYGPGQFLAPLLGVGVFFGVLLLAKGVSLLVDHAIKLKKEKEKEKKATEVTTEQNEAIQKQEEAKQAAVQQAAQAVESTKDWAFRRAELEKKMMLELWAAELEVELEAAKAKIKAAAFRFPEDARIIVEKKTQFTTEKQQSFVKEKIKSLIKWLKKFRRPGATWLETFRGPVLLVLDFAVGYMMGCILGFVTTDFLSHIPEFAPFADGLVANLAVGIFSLIAGLSNARRGWLTEQVHLSELEILRLKDKKYKEDAKELKGLQIENAALKEQLKNAIAKAMAGFEHKDDPTYLRLENLAKRLEKFKEPGVKRHKVLNVVRAILFVMTSFSSVILMSRALIVMGFSKAFAPLTVGGSLVLFTSTGGLNPLGIGVLAVALMFLALRVVNRMYLTAQKEQELEKIKCIDRRLAEARQEKEQFQVISGFVNSNLEVIPEERKRPGDLSSGESQRGGALQGRNYSDPSLPSSLDASANNTGGNVSTAASPFKRSRAELPDKEPKKPGGRLSEEDRDKIDTKLKQSSSPGILERQSLKPNAQKKLSF